MLIKGGIVLGDYYVHETAVIDDNVSIGSDTRIWHFSHIQSGAEIGSGCNIGQNTFVGSEAKIGNGVKLQNNVSVYSGVELEDYVFCGPSSVFTNDLTPRARFPKNGKYKRTVVRHDATLGANSTIVCGHEIGHHATIAAGAVVTSNVIPYALMAGVPAKRIGWVCECGQVLRDDLSCPDCGRNYEYDHEKVSIKEN